MITLNNLAAPKGSHRATKRLGRGQGSGQGTQAGKGHKGQKARKGGKVRTAFEGNNLPLYMRLPKRGFKNYPFKEEYATFNFRDLDRAFEAGATVSRETLQEKGLLKGRHRHLPIKVLGTGVLSGKMTFKGIAKFSETAAEYLKKNGHKVIEEPKAAQEA